MQFLHACRLGAPQPPPAHGCSRPIPPLPPATPQFLIHLTGYLLLEISQTILIWLISSKNMWNGPERASQEYVGLTLACFMVSAARGLAMWCGCGR
jgi:hypothetical protein